MTQNIQVRCLINRFWDPSEIDWDGDWEYGTLIDVSTQSAEDASGKLVPVGIILLDDGTFHCVPMKFIEKTTI